MKNILCFFGLHDFIRIGSFETKQGFTAKKMLGGVYDFFICIHCEKGKINKKEQSDEKSK